MAALLSLSVSSLHSASTVYKSTRMDVSLPSVPFTPRETSVVSHSRRLRCDRTDLSLSAIVESSVGRLQRAIRLFPQALGRLPSKRTKGP